MKAGCYEPCGTRLLVSLSFCPRLCVESTFEEVAQ